MSERKAIFISHASPEDNPFTLWLGAKLAALGYEVWADVLRLTGGEDWRRKLENAIRERACKYYGRQCALGTETRRSQRNSNRFRSGTKDRRPGVHHTAQAHAL